MSEEIHVGGAWLRPEAIDAIQDHSGLLVVHLRGGQTLRIPMGDTPFEDFVREAFGVEDEEDEVLVRESDLPPVATNNPGWAATPAGEVPVVWGPEGETGAVDLPLAWASVESHRRDPDRLRLSGLAHLALHRYFTEHHPTEEDPGA